MPRQALNLAFFVLEEAIKYEPAIAVAIQRMFNKGTPTPWDWAELHASVADKSYRDYVPDSALPASEISD